METIFKIETDAVRVLLEKYFNGETTLQEESTLRKYFSQSVIEPEFKQYAPLFNYFSHEQEEVKKPVFNLKLRRHAAPRKMLFRSFSLSAAAAIAIFAYIMWPVPQRGVEMMVGGEKINNEQLAISKVDVHLKKISTMMSLIGKNTNSMKKLNTVEKSLSIINKK